MIKIWGNKDGCVEQYCCATALYLSSILAHEYNTIIDHVIGAPVHNIEAVCGFNAT